MTSILPNAFATLFNKEGGPMVKLPMPPMHPFPEYLLYNGYVFKSNHDAGGTYVEVDVYRYPRGQVRSGQ